MSAARNGLLECVFQMLRVRVGELGAIRQGNEWLAEVEAEVRAAGRAERDREWREAVGAIRREEPAGYCEPGCFDALEARMALPPVDEPDPFAPGQPPVTTFGPTPEEADEAIRPRRRGRR